jgi:hypothetical protein
VIIKRRKKNEFSRERLDLESLRWRRTRWWKKTGLGEKTMRRRAEEGWRVEREEGLRLFALESFSEKRDWPVASPVSQ